MIRKWLKARRRARWIALLQQAREKRRQFVKTTLDLAVASEPPFHVCRPIGAFDWYVIEVMGEGRWIRVRDSAPTYMAAQRKMMRLAYPGPHVAGERIDEGSLVYIGKDGLVRQCKRSD